MQVFIVMATHYKIWQCGHSHSPTLHCISALYVVFYSICISIQTVDILEAGA